MSLIDRVAYLRKRGDFVATSREMNDLLAILGKFREGDSTICEELMEIVNPGKIDPMENEDELTEKTEAAWNMLRRYRDMADEMERSR